MKRQERLDDLQTSLRLALDDRQAHMWTSMPAIVTKVNLEDQTIEAQPAIQAIITDREGKESNINLPLVVDVPIVWPRAGGFSLTFPIKIGDEVLINFASRCIDSWWQSGDIGAQVEKRMHDLSDGFAILAPTSQPNKLSAVSSTSVQLRSDAGGSFVEIDSDGNVNITTASKVSVDCDQLDINATTQVDITAPTIDMKAATQFDVTSPIINLTGDVNIDGGLTVTDDVTGNLTVTGTVDAQSGVISSGTAFNGHTHGGVQPGGGFTGPPV